MSTRNNQVVVPAARYALDTLKFEIADEIGLRDYDSVDKGNLTSRQNGSVGGFMVKRMIEDYEHRVADTNITFR